mmetsp:Transcript_94937/g.163797  ORF Transcript_94937/g.163797 Transcript_94937/m.163797 type:complete len:231 (-) Transcript_94937:12246-12938(-)
MGPAPTAAGEVACASVMRVTTAQTAPKSALAGPMTRALAMASAVTAGTETGRALALMIHYMGTGAGKNAATAWPISGVWWGPTLMTVTTAPSPASPVCRATAGTVWKGMVSVSASLGRMETSAKASAQVARTTCARAMGYATGATQQMGHALVNSAIGVRHASFPAQECRWRTPTPACHSLLATPAGTMERFRPARTAIPPSSAYSIPRVDCCCWIAMATGPLLSSTVVR